MAFILVSLCSLENALQFDTKKSIFVCRLMLGFQKNIHKCYNVIYTDHHQVRLKLKRIETDTKKNLYHSHFVGIFI